MKAHMTFTVGQTILLMICSFLWGGSVVQYVTGYLSTLALVLNSATILCVIAVVVLAARKRRAEPTASQTIPGAKGSAA